MILQRFDALSKQFKVRRKTFTFNDLGSEIATWKTIDTISGVIDTLSGSERSIGGKIVQDSTHVLIINEQIDISVDDRLLQDGKQYDVTNVDVPLGASHMEVEVKYIRTEEDDFVNSIFFGVSAVQSLTEVEINAFESVVTEERKLLQTLVPVTQYVYVVYPASFGDATIRANNVLELDWIKSEVVVNGINSFVYRSKNTKDGSIKLELS